MKECKMSLRFFKSRKRKIKNLVKFCNYFQKIGVRTFSSESEVYYNYMFFHEFDYVDFNALNMFEKIFFFNPKKDISQNFFKSSFAVSKKPIKNNAHLVIFRFSYNPNSWMSHESRIDEISNNALFSAYNDSNEKDDPHPLISTTYSDSPTYKSEPMVEIMFFVKKHLIQKSFLLFLRTVKCIVLGQKALINFLPYFGKFDDYKKYESIAGKIYMYCADFYHLSYLFYQIEQDRTPLTEVLLANPINNKKFGEELIVYTKMDKVHAKKFFEHLFTKHANTLDSDEVLQIVDNYLNFWIAPQSILHSFLVECCKEEIFDIFPRSFFKCVISREKEL